MSPALQDVFTADELARAARVPVAAVKALIASGELNFVTGTQYVSAEEAVRAGRQLRAGIEGAVATLAPVDITPEPLFARVVQKSRFAARQRGVHAFSSSAIHAVLLVALLWWTSGSTESAAIAETCTRALDRARTVRVFKRQAPSAPSGPSRSCRRYRE